VFCVSCSVTQRGSFYFFEEESGVVRVTTTRQNVRCQHLLVTLEAKTERSEKEEEGAILFICLAAFCIPSQNPKNPRSFDCVVVLFVLTQAKIGDFQRERIKNRDPVASKAAYMAHRQLH